MREFHDRDLHPYVLNFDCVVQAHGVRQELVGGSLYEFRDQDGKFVARDTVEVAKTLGHATAPSTYAATEPTRQDVAERRQLTVMFCDLVGSTALSARLDPEDLRSVIGAYHKCVAETIARFDGFVAKYVGDGVLVYFGYPQAHEHDAERAVRAGLNLVEAVPKLATMPVRPCRFVSASPPGSSWSAT